MYSKSRNAEIINHEILNNVRSLGNDVFLEMVDLFIEESSELLTKIRGAFLDGDTDQLMIFAHNVKGASANMGAAALAEICAEVEDQAKSEHLSGIEMLLQRLEKVHEQTITAFKMLRG